MQLHDIQEMTKLVQPFLHPVWLVVVAVAAKLYHRLWVKVDRQAFERTEVMIFSIIDGMLQSQVLRTFQTTLFGKEIFRQLVHWNDTLSHDVIVPRQKTGFARTLNVRPKPSDPTSPILSLKLSNLLHTLAAESLLSMYLIDHYLKDAAQCKEQGCWPHATFIVALIRPDAHKLPLLDDCPRVAIIELGALRRIRDAPSEIIANGSNEVWLHALQYIGELYLVQNDPTAMSSVKIPLRL